MPQDTGGILNLKKPVGSDDIRLQTIGIDLPYNFQKIDDAFTAHQAESAQKHIAESGSNDNGYYIKFDDGTQICWSFINLGSISITTPNDALYGTSNLTWYLPLVFISPPVFVGTTFGAYIMGYIAGMGTWKDRIAYRIMNTRSYSPDNARVLMIAIGRWK